MSAPHVLGLLVPRQLLERVLADRLEHAQPVRRRARAGSRRASVAIPSSDASQTADRRLEREPAAEDSEPREELLLVRRRAGRSSRRSCRAASGAGRAGRAAPGRGGRAARRAEREHRLGREQLRPRGRQLEGERQAVEARADLLDGAAARLREREARVGRLRALDEQRDRVVAASSGVDRVLALAADAQRRPARHEERQPGRRVEQLRDDRRRFEELLEVVEHERARGARRARSERLSRSDRSPLSRTPSASAIAGSRSAVSRIASSATKKAPSGEVARRARSRPRRASRVFPVPPGPVSVSSARVSAGALDDHLVELAAAADDRARRTRHVAGAGERAAERRPRPGAGSPARARAAPGPARGRARRRARCRASRYASSASAWRPGAVEREHQLAAEPLPQRVLGDERLELADAPGRGGRARGRPRSGSRAPASRSSSSRAISRLRERLVGEVGERPGRARARAPRRRSSAASPYARRPSAAAPPRRAARSARRRARRARPEAVAEPPSSISAVGDAACAAARRRPGACSPRSRRASRPRARRSADRPSDELVSVQEKQREQCTRLTAFYRERRAVRSTSSGPRMRYSIGFFSSPTDRNAQVSGFFQGLVGAS